MITPAKECDVRHTHQEAIEMLKVKSKDELIKLVGEGWKENPMTVREAHLLYMGYVLGLDDGEKRAQNRMLLDLEEKINGKA
jgi:hypothetical protein